MSFLEAMIFDLCNLSLESGFASSLNQTLASYNSSANTAIITLMKNSVFAVGASLLTLFMLMELTAMVNRANGGESGLGSIKLPANVLIKFAVFAFLFCHIPSILGGIEKVAVDIGNEMVSAASFDFGVGIGTAQVTTMANAIDNLGFFDRIFTYIVIFVCWLFVHFVEGIIQITVAFRAFELWLLLLFSPIPLATVASAEFRQTAINFLKTFMAVSMQGAAIIACFMIYQSLMGSFVKDFDPSGDVSQFVNSFLLQNILYAAVLTVSVFSSGKIIKQIMGAL